MEYLVEQKEWQGCKECGKGESFKVKTVEKWVKAIIITGYKSGK